MSAGGEDEGGNVCGCLGCAVILPVLLAMIGIFVGSAEITIGALIVGALLAVGAYAFAKDTGPAKTPTSDGDDDGRDSSTPSATNPRGRGITPWVRASKMQKTVGEFYRQASYESLAGQYGIAKDGERNTLDVTARIGLDRGNKHALHGTAITVSAHGQLLGYLPDEVVRDYLEVLEEIDRANLHIATDARIYLTYNQRKRKWSPSMVVRLPEPDQILPLNGLPPRHAEVIPDGPSIQVVGEENRQDILKPLADLDEKTHYAATLHRVLEKRARSTVETIEVRIDGDRIGTLTPTSAAKVGPLVDLIEAAELEAYARTVLTVTEKGVQAALRVTRPDEAPEGWLRMLERRAAREQQDRDAEDGGA